MTRVNHLLPVSIDDVLAAQSRLERVFPDSLKRVWQTRGAGFVVASLDGQRTTTNINRFCDPVSIVELVQGEYPADGTQFGTGIPFFEVYADRFLMADAGHGCDVVTDQYGNTIAKSVDEFMERLLENPEYYDTFLDAGSTAVVVQ